jgi:dynein regulatory complex protein 1
MESSFAESRRRQEEEFEKAIEKLRVEGMQTFTSTKIKMENDIQNLEKCYEEMKALYQLNTEKLDYNLKILKEKKEENHENHEELKKKESILNTRYRNLRSQYEKEDQRFKDTNKQLTADYKRITRQFKELQRKFKHFEKSDLERYNEIQAMNEKEVQELKDKIIKCDKVIHNQQLGLDWLALNAPDDDRPEEKPLVADNEDDEEQETQLAVSEEKLSELLDILIEEGDFIFDDKMREELERASQEEKLK